MERETDLRWGGERLALGHLGKHVNKSTSIDSLLYHTFTDTFLRADLVAVFHSMQGEINLRNWLLVLYGLRQMIDGCTTVHYCGVGWNSEGNGGDSLEFFVSYRCRSPCANANAACGTTRQKGHGRVATECSAKDLLIILFQARYWRSLLCRWTRNGYIQELDNTDIEEANGGTSLCTRQQKVGYYRGQLTD